MSSTSWACYASWLQPKLLQSPGGHRNESVFDGNLSTLSKPPATHRVKTFPSSGGLSSFSFLRVRSNSFSRTRLGWIPHHARRALEGFAVQGSWSSLVHWIVEDPTIIYNHLQSSINKGFEPHMTCCEMKGFQKIYWIPLQTSWGSSMTLCEGPCFGAKRSFLTSDLQLQSHQKALKKWSLSEWFKNDLTSMASNLVKGSAQV